MKMDDVYTLIVSLTIIAVLLFVSDKARMVVVAMFGGGAGHRERDEK